MASVYRRPGSNFWMARFKTPDGTWAARSTKEKNEAKALRIAFELEGAGSTLQTDNPTAAQLDRVVRSIWERHTGRRIALNRADEFLRQWVANMARKPGTLERYRQVTEEFIEHLGERAAFDLKAIEPSHCQAFVKRDIELGRSGTTVGLNAKILRAAFNSAMRAGYLESNPAGALQLPDAVSEEREPFTAGEIETLLRAKKGTDWETAIMLGAFAGLRIGDAATLKWESVDLAAGLIKFVPQKTSRKAKQVIVPLSDRVKAHLERLASTDAAQSSPYVCPSLASVEVGGRRGLSAAFVAIMDGANVETGASEAKDGRIRKFSKKTFHSLRHFFASRLAETGISDAVRASLVGHADPKETRRYTHVEFETRRKAVNAVSSLAKGGKK